ncbi:MAG TPA: TIGR00730 family Rossman fold protein [Streptosporangiaceae bacterium]|nr:TIGR00730 family Rossman fold protein [Streptosporangiaceae bacterium]
MRVAVFLGSSTGREPEYVLAAADFGRQLARAGVGIVYGGASVGMMGALADAALAEGGEVIGVIPGGLFAAEIPHPGLTRLEVVGTMHERKALMAALADGFAALPGGLGTLDELFEILTWQQLGLHAKPVALVDVGGFWDPLTRLLGGLTEAGFVLQAARDSLVRVDDADEFLTLLA